MTDPKSTVSVSEKQEEYKLRYQYWSLLRTLNVEYTEIIGPNLGMTKSTFHFWVEETYGMRIGINGTGEYTSGYEIVDQNKFLMLKLKHNF